MKSLSFRNGYEAKNCVSLVFRKYRAQTTPRSDLYCKEFLYYIDFLQPLIAAECILGFLALYVLNYYNRTDNA